MLGLVLLGNSLVWIGLRDVFVQVDQDCQGFIALSGDSAFSVFGEMALELVDQGGGHHHTAVLRAFADHVQDPADVLATGIVDVVDRLQVPALGRAQLRGAKSGGIQPVQRTRSAPTQGALISRRHGFQHGPLIARQGSARAQRPNRHLGWGHPSKRIADHVGLLHEEVEQTIQDPLRLLPRTRLQRALDRSPQRRPALQVPGGAPARRRILQKRHVGRGIFCRERGHRLAALQHRPQQQALSFPAVRALGVGLLVLGGQPGHDGLVVVAGRQHAAMGPKLTLAAVQLGRHPELLQRHQVGGGLDHPGQLLGIGL